MSEEEKKSKEYQDIDTLASEIQGLRSQNAKLRTELEELKTYIAGVTDKTFMKDCGSPSQAH